MGRHVIILFAALFIAASGLISCTTIDKPEVRLQEIDLTLHPESHGVAGVSRVLMRTRGTSRFTFTLSPDANVAGVTVEGKSVPFTFSYGFLSIELPEDTGDSTVSLEISYSCGFNDQPPKDSVSGEDPTYGIGAIVSINGVFLGPGAGWYPSPAIVPARRRVKVTSPAGFEAITAGRRILRGTAGDKTVSQWEEDRPAGGLSLSAGRYVIGESDLHGIPIYTYFTRENAGLASLYLESSSRYLRFYEELFGPYPFEKFAVVENFFPTGYGFPSYTLLGSTVIRLPFIPDTSLPHEIAHSWWGNGVQVDPIQGNWSEGLVTYLADYLLKERKSPEEGKEYRSILLSDYASLVTPDREFPLGEFTNRIDPASRIIGYGKGMMVFHMVRRMVGDDIFFRGLRELCRDKLYSAATWGDFMDTFSRLSGKDLFRFRDQWLKREGGPRLSFAGVKATGKGSDWTVSGEVSQSQPLYTVPLHLGLQTSAGVEGQELAINNLRTPFSFKTKAPPRRLMLDPDAELFRILAPEEMPPTINRIKGARSLVAVITPECRAGRKTIDLLLESLGQGGASIITEKEADEKRIGRHDLLFCGSPERLRIFGGVAGNSFTAGGETFSGPDDALFKVTRYPEGGERIAAIFQPLSAKAAASCVLKITHYGKYSYLAFSGGSNRQKGIEKVSSGVSDIVFHAGN